MAIYKTPRLAAGAICALAMAVPMISNAQSKAEFDALKKRIAELEAKTQQMDAADHKGVIEQETNKIKLSDSITELKIYGDTGVRYQNDQFDAQLDTPAGKASTVAKLGDIPNITQRSRFMFKLRLFADFKLGDQFFGGFGLSTNPGSDLNYQPFTGGYDKFNIFITKAFFGYKPTDWLKVIIGKQTNPFYTTDLVWDPEINPQGVVEVVDVGKALFPDSPFSLQLVGAQFAFQDNAESSLNNDLASDAWQFVEQAKASYKFCKDVSLTVAPGFITYNSANLSGLLNVRAFSAPQDGLIGGGETRDLQILTAPGDFSFKVLGIKSKLYWDFAYNCNGPKRFNDIYGVGAQGHSGRDDTAWLAGFQLGEAKKAGDWMLFANYREIGMASIDPNINDSDFALSALNVRGVKVGAQYCFTDAFTAAITYSHAWNLKENLTGGQATGGAGLANVNNADVLQVDFGVNF